MPLPVIPDVYQVVLNWSNANAPRDAANTLHFLDTVGTQTVANLNADIEASVGAIQWQAVTASARVNAMRITPLDGATAGTTFVVAAAAKWTGGGGVDAILQGSQVVSLKSAQRGPRGRNRVFLPWVAEDRQVNGTIDGVVTGNVAGAWATFTSTMLAAGWQLVAVSALHNEANDVINLSVSSAMKTQRRRARR